MTIVQPSRNNLSAMNILIFSMMLLLAATAVFGMFVYNQLVSLRHDIINIKSGLNRAAVDNADLKNKIYSLTDPKNFAVVAEDNSLVIDNNPKYLKSGQEVSANY